MTWQKKTKDDGDDAASFRYSVQSVDIAKDVSTFEPSRAVHNADRFPKKARTGGLAEEYVVIDEVKEGLRSGRRSTLRINIHDTPRGKEERVLSPLTRELSPIPQDSYLRHSRSAEAPAGERYVRREQSPSFRRIYIREEDNPRRREQSPSPPRDYVREEATTRHRSNVEEPPTRRLSPRDLIQERIVEEDYENYYRGRSRAPRPEYDDWAYEPRERTVPRAPISDYSNRRSPIRQRPAQRAPASDYERRRSPPRRDYIVEDHETDAASLRSRDAADRRRQERALDAPAPALASVPAQRGELPHNIGPLKDGEYVVVTERYVYRPKRLENVQEVDELADFRPQRRERLVRSPEPEWRDIRRQRQDYVDSRTLGGNRQYQKIDGEADASEYYDNEWNSERPPRETSTEKGNRHRVRPRDLRESKEDLQPHLQENANTFEIRRDGM